MNTGEQWACNMIEIALALVHMSDINTHTMGEHV